VPGPRVLTDIHIVTDIFYTFHYKMVRIILPAALVALVSAAHEEGIGEAAAAFKAAGESYRNAAGSVSTSAGGASGAVHDTSFLQSRGFVRPIIARIMGEDAAAGEFERKTQSPLVFLHMHNSFLANRNPSFPGSAESASSTISRVLSSATGGGKNDGAAVQAAIANGSKSLGARVASDMNLSALRKDAFIAVHMRVRKMLHNGGCPRSFSGCPIDFAERDGGCHPGSTYDGFCSAQSFNGFSTAQKEDWSFKCGASWPCA
jgi:CPW-WPC domain-containing protein